MKYMTTKETFTLMVFQNKVVSCKVRLHGSYLEKKLQQYASKENRTKEV